LGNTRILPARFPEDAGVLRSLFRAYEKFLGFSLCFQGFEEELATLPGKYAPPSGGCWIAWKEQKAAGCVALRMHAEGIGEVKRLYVIDEAKGEGTGRKLMQCVIEEARTRGYRELWLDTVSRLDPALQLYHSLGFRMIDPYNEAPDPEIVYLGLKLLPDTN